MNQLRDNTVVCRRPSNRMKGFRVNSRRITVYRFRIKFLNFIRLLSRWNLIKSSCGQALDSLKKGIIIGRSSSRRSTSSSGSSSYVSSRRSSESVQSRHSDSNRRDLAPIKSSYCRSNSFYSEAISDCLEFIKKSAALSVDHEISVSR